MEARKCHHAPYVGARIMATFTKPRPPSPFGIRTLSRRPCCPAKSIPSALMPVFFFLLGGPLRSPHSLSTVALDFRSLYSLFIFALYIRSLPSRCALHLRSYPRRSLSLSRRVCPRQRWRFVQLHPPGISQACQRLVIIKVGSPPPWL